MKKILLTIVLLFALCGIVQADTLTIPNEGVIIRESKGTDNQSRFVFLLLGNGTDPADIMRSVIAFPLNTPELTGAAVNSVTITFTGRQEDTGSTGIRNIALHECSSFVNTEVTWFDRSLSTAWTTPGGDYGPVLDTQTVDTDIWDASSSVTFSGEALAAAINSKLGGTFYALVKMADDTTATSRSLIWCNDIASITIDYTDLSANTPFPEDGIYYEDTSVTFGWKPGIDPANQSVPNPAILKHRLTYRTGDPNFLAAGTTTVEIDADADLDGQVDPDAVYGPVTFGLDQVVYWKIDEIIADANDILGNVWSFTTLQSTPEINPALPADALVDLGEYAELTVEATNPFTGDASGLSYQWMYSPDGITYSTIDTSSPILAFASAQAADTGYYYCDVTIDSNGKSASSRVARLIVKQTLAHWTMDQADYVNGFYLDIAGTHNAEPNSAPTFVAGAGPDMPEAGAAVMNPNSFAAVGTWNPVETTGQMTLSTWIKWDGSDIGTYGKDILSKLDAWGTDTMMWSLKIRGVDTNGNAGIWFYSFDDYGIRLPGLVPVDTWTHLCVTYAPGQSQMYINGELRATNNNAALSTGTTSTMDIGGGSTGSVFPGAMDEVMFHNYAMSAEDAATLYYQTSKEGVCLYPPAIDFNGDCKTDLIDLAEFAKTWLACGLTPVEACNQ